MFVATMHVFVQGYWRMTTIDDKKRVKQGKRKVMVVCFLARE